MSFDALSPGDVLEIRKKDLLIRKIRTGDCEEWDENGMVFDAFPIEVELVQGDARFLVSSLLPSGWRMLETDALEYGVGGMCAKPEEGTYVGIPISQPEKEDEEEPRPHLETDFSIAFLLHELGHARRFATMSPKELAEFALITDFKSGDATVVTSEESRLLRTYVYQDERRAWTYALHDMRRLQVMGINAEPNATKDDLRKHIESCVGSYREGLLKIGVKLGR